MAEREEKLRFKINKDKVTYRIINKEVVILHLQRGFYYSLNKTGSLVWELIKKGEDLEHVHEILAKKFNQKKDVVKRDVCSLLKQLEKEALIEKSKKG